MSMHFGKMNRRTFLQQIGTAGAAAATASFSLPARAAQPERTLRYTSLFPAGTPDAVSADFFADEVSKRTEGRLRIQVFHNAVLGGDLEAAQGIMNGTIDMGRAGTAGYGTFMPDVRGPFEMPYEYKNEDEMKRVADGVFDVLSAHFQERGVKLIGYNFDGPRMTLSTKPLKSMADLKGVRYRVPQTPVYVMMVKAFGAVPTPISLPELYTALQAGIVDALEGSASNLYNGKFYEVAKYLLRTDHIYNPTFLSVNGNVYASLSPEFQQVLLDVGHDASDYNLKLLKESNKTDLDRLLATGVTEAKPDLAPFVEATRIPNQEFIEQIGGKATEFYAMAQKILHS
jgi:tripartite ATP-independent transporter DctP family solute receptor